MITFVLIKCPEVEKNNKRIYLFPKQYKNYFKQNFLIIQVFEHKLNSYFRNIINFLFNIKLKYNYKLSI